MGTKVGSGPGNNTGDKDPNLKQKYLSDSCKVKGRKQLARARLATETKCLKNTKG